MNKSSARRKVWSYMDNNQNNNQPKISIIVPVYNIEGYLERCLDSILDQDLPDFEVIAINDGSTDKSGFILEKYAQKDSRIHLVNVENGGAGWARNNGIDKAVGEYLMFVDGDDFILPKCLSTLYNCAQTNNADLVIFSYRHYWDESGWGNTPKDLYYQDKVMDALTATQLMLLGNDVLLWNKLVSRSLYIKANIRFKEGMLNEDYPVSCAMITNAKRIFYINTLFYVYVQRNTSVSNVPATAKKTCDNVYSVDMVWEEIQKAGWEKELAREFDYKYIETIIGLIQRCYAHPEQYKSPKELQIASVFLEDRLAKISLNRTFSNKYLNFKQKLKIIRLKLGLYKLQKKIIRFLKNKG